jgi:HB1, ASXL, restriction endonuclease HTH domain
MAAELTWRQAIDKTLGASPTPLHYNEISQRIIAEGLRKSLGATPSATVNAQISASIKHDGANSPYVRVANGTFALAKAANVLQTTPTNKLTPSIPESEEDEEQYEIVTSFGMFWRRNAIEWIATPKLLGMQQIGATPVDFNKQLGIYLLYDGREVIYVGRTTDRPLGRRLFEHTSDRMAVRWDRFSWFGLLPVSETGTLGNLPLTFEAAKMIPALEAILIEAMEPRQNRKRGDDLSAVEYIQREDPAIEKKRLRESFELAINKLN